MPDETTTRPALSAEEWNEAQGETGYAWLPAYPGFDFYARIEGKRLVLGGGDEDGTLAVEDGRHALAALALYGTPEGFSREDVEALRAEWHDGECGALYALYDAECDCATRPALARLYSLADRIAALLPP